MNYKSSHWFWPSDSSLLTPPFTELAFLLVNKGRETFLQQGEPQKWAKAGGKEERGICGDFLPLHPTSWCSITQGFFLPVGGTVLGRHPTASW